MCWCVTLLKCCSFRWSELNFTSLIKPIWKFLLGDNLINATLIFWVPYEKSPWGIKIKRKHNAHNQGALNKQKNYFMYRGLWYRRIQESYNDYENREEKVLPMEMNNWLHKMMELEKWVSQMRREEFEERNGLDHGNP